MKNILVLTAAAVVVICSGLAVSYLISAPARAAARNLAAINGITVGQTTEADLLRRSEFQNLEAVCFAGDCLYHMEAQNTLLSSLRLAPRINLATVVKVRNGTVTGVSVLGWRQGMPGLSLNQMEETDCHSNPCLKKLIPPNHILALTKIEFNSRSGIRNRMPSAVNSRCLSRLRGCTTDAELMPILQEITPSEASR